MKIKSILATACALTVVTGAAFGTIAFLTDRDEVNNTFTVGDVQISVEETDVNENGDILFDTDGDGDADVAVDPETGAITDPVTGEEVPGSDYAYDEETGNLVPGDGSNPIPPMTTEEGNEYHLVPGMEYVKDPTVTIAEGSEKAYVRMLVTVKGAAELDQLFNEYKSENFKLEHILPEGSLNTTDWVFEGATDNTAENTRTFEYRFATVVTGANGELPALFTEIVVPSMLTGDDLRQMVEAEFAIKVVGQAIQAATFDNADEAWVAFTEQNNP